VSEDGSRTIRPLLFLGVDGTLLPLNGSRRSPPVSNRDGWQDPGNPMLHRVDRAHGPRLLALGCELMWATAWMEDANEVIAPLLGLPRLPVAALPVRQPDRLPDGLHWKTRVLVELANGRPFVWLDHEFGVNDGAWVAGNHPGPALLHHVDPGRGLGEQDLATVGAWLSAATAAG
jgi:hypothetical protein